MRVPRIAAAAGVLAVTASLLAGCAPGDEAVDQVITVNGFEPSGPLIPAEADDPGAIRILGQLFAGLVSYDESGAAVPDLAESIQPNADNTVYTISINDDATFTDGEAVTAESFANAWDWAATASHAALNRRYFSDFLGFDPEKDVSLIEAGGVVVLDDSTLEIHLKSASTDLPLRLGHIAFSPMPAAFYADPAGFGENPIGNGPYMFDGPDAWSHGERLELVVNPGYEGHREPANDGITMRFYDSLDVAYADVLSGNLDLLDTLPADAVRTFKDELTKRWVSSPLANLESLVIPSSTLHFSGAEGALRRHAIAQAIDRKAIIDELFGATRIPAADFTSPAVETWSDTLTGNEAMIFNKDAANENWAKADAMKPWEGTLEIAYNADGGHGAWVDLVAAQLESVLKIDVAGVPYPSLGDLQAAIEAGETTAAYRNGWRADYPGVLAFIGSRFHSKGTANSGAYKSTAYDTFLRRGATAKSPNDAEDAYREAQQVLLADLPAIPLWNGTAQAVFGEGIDDVALDWQGVPQYYQITKHSR